MKKPTPKQAGNTTTAPGAIKGRGTRRGASIATSELNSIAQGHPKFVQPLAREAIVWPSMVGRSTKSVNAWREFLSNTLQLGRENPISNTGRIPPSENTPVNKIARRYLSAMLSVRREEIEILQLPEDFRSVAGRLPPFTKKTARDWANVALELFAEELTRHPVLLSRGECHRGNSVRKRKGRHAKATTKTERADVWDGGKEAFRLAFVTLAAK